MIPDAFAQILTLLIVGFALARTTLLPSNAAETLNLVVLYVCLPAAVLLHMPKLELDPTLIAVAATPWLVMLATALVVGGLAKLLAFPREVHGALLLCVGLGNTSFLGFPMVRALLGDEAVPYAVVYDQLGSFILLSTVGLYVVASFRGAKAPNLRDMSKRIVTFPPAWALLIGLTVMPVAPPPWIGSGLATLADAMMPLVMLAVGLSIQLKPPAEDVRPLVIGLSLRLLVMPLVALPVGWLAEMPELMFRTTVVEAAMPSMVSGAALAMAAGLAPRLCASLVGYGIVLSMVTVPAWAYLSHVIYQAMP